jgi:hypothetical protein
MSLKTNLIPQEISEIKNKFDAYMEIKNRKKELSDEEKAIKQDVANIIEGKLKDASLLMKTMAQQYESGENDVFEVGSVMELIQSNGVS